MKADRASAGASALPLMRTGGVMFSGETMKCFARWQGVEGGRTKLST